MNPQPEKLNWSVVSAASLDQSTEQKSHPLKMW